MANSKDRRRARRLREKLNVIVAIQSQQKPQQPEALQQETQKRSYWRILATPLGIFVAVIGLVSGGLTIWDWYYGSVPTIHLTDSDADNPFLFPFAVKNGSNLFDMKDVRWTCIIRSATDTTGSIYSDVAASGGTIIQIYAHSPPTNIGCGIHMGGLVFISMIVDVHIE
jgi:hypothetical protein